MDGRKTFLITGVNSGLGAAFAKGALAAGHTVVGTVRGADKIAVFEALAPGRAHGLDLELTDFARIPQVVAAAEAIGGGVDVLVNNAGYGHEGALEESGLDALVRQFEVNVFSAVELIRAVLPAMRERRAGHIVNVTSMAGLVGFPGLAYYCGSKFALQGITEALAAEVKPFGIRVTALAPGQFRTDWAGRSMERTPRSIDDYDAVMDPIRGARLAKSGAQPGDPARAAEALLRLVGYPNPPPLLLLGRDAVQLVFNRRKQVDQQIAAWNELSSSTGFATEPD